MSFAIFVGTPFLELVSVGAFCKAINGVAKVGVFWVVCKPVLLDVIEVEVPRGEYTPKLPGFLVASSRVVGT